jgi:hypothetical protein
MFEWNVDVWLEQKVDPWFLKDWNDVDDDGSEYDDDFDRCFEQGFRYDE